MSYRVLALKWRPKTFDEVVGQDTVVRTLKNALTTGRVGHAFLLSGARGVGKTTTARILAKALNCAQAEGPSARPCGECSACDEIAKGTCLDVQEIDGATNNGVDQVRELRESARYNPARDRFKLWIIDEVHMLSGPAFNALLKTLEEPPPRVKFIFATTEYHKLPDTILSRCQQYDFRMIPTKDLIAHLRKVAGGEGIEVSDEALGRIARAAEGSVRDALSLFDQILSFSGDEVKDEDLSALLGLVDRELLTSASRAVADGDSLAVFYLVERLAEYGTDYRSFCRELLLYLREILVVKLAPDTSPLLSPIAPEERQSMRPLAEAFSEEDLLRAVDVLTQVEKELTWAQDPRVTLELALLKLVQTRRLLPFTELVARVEGLAQGVPGHGTGTDRSSHPRATPTTGRADAAAPPASPASHPHEAAEPAAGPDSAPGEAILHGMVEEVQSRPSLAQPLRAASARLEEDTIVLEVPPDFVLLAEMHLDEYERLARQVARRPLSLRVLAGATSAAAAPAPTQAEVKRERLMKEAVREPAVQEALELFNGKIVDVRDA
jgi:DNA polymerase-3 subunit gamma/tau